LFSASGDSGANGRTDPECTIKHLRPAFPGSSPFVTAVGATELTATTPLSNAPSICKSAGLECVVGGHEQAVSYAISGFASGGGFSDIAAQPSYQSAAVAAYFNSGVKFPDTGYFNRSGRGFPDVGALVRNHTHNVITLPSLAAPKKVRSKLLTQTCEFVPLFCCSYRVTTF
jgi:tripeptidyl-peptidase-1